MKKSFRKTTFLSALAIAVPAMGMAQDKVEASAGADLVSGYIWRAAHLAACGILRIVLWGVGFVTAAGNF